MSLSALTNILIYYIVSFFFSSTCSLIIIYFCLQLVCQFSPCFTSYFKYYPSAPVFFCPICYSSLTNSCIFSTTTHPLTTTVVSVTLIHDQLVLYSHPTCWLLCLFHGFPKSLQTSGLVHNLKQDMNTPTSLSIHSLMYSCISNSLIKLHWILDFIHRPVFKNTKNENNILETGYVTNLRCEGDGLMSTLCTSLLYWLGPTE